MEAPPSRYRVVERGGRLVVLDSAVGGAPLAAKDLLPGGGKDTVAERFDAFFREGGEGEAGTPPAPQRPAAAETMIATPRGLLRNIASTVCGDRRDGDGRLQWKTARWFDTKGPRTVALSQAGERQLGIVTLALLIVTVGEIIFAVGNLIIGFALALITVELLRRAKPVATAWIDRLASR